MTEDEMVGWHHQLSGHEFNKLQEIVRTGKPGMLQCIGSQLDTTEQLNNNSNHSSFLRYSPLTFGKRALSGSPALLQQTPMAILCEMRH